MNTAFVTLFRTPFPTGKGGKGRAAEGDKGKDENLDQDYPIPVSQMNFQRPTRRRQNRQQNLRFVIITSTTLNALQAYFHTPNSVSETDHLRACILALVNELALLRPAPEKLERDTTVPLIQGDDTPLQAKFHPTHLAH